MTLERYNEDPDKIVIDDKSDHALERGMSVEAVWVITDDAKDQTKKLHDDGFRSINICFLHSSTYPKHEQQIAEIAAYFGMSMSVRSTLQPKVCLPMNLIRHLL